MTLNGHFCHVKVRVFFSIFQLLKVQYCTYFISRDLKVKADDLIAEARELMKKDFELLTPIPSSDPPPNYCSPQKKKYEETCPRSFPEKATADEELALPVIDDNADGPSQELPYKRAPLPEEAGETRNSQLELCLPTGWYDALRPQDRRWVSKIFRWISNIAPKMADGQQRKRGVCLKEEYHTVMWVYPPSPRGIYSKMPNPDLFYAQSLCIWAPFLRWGFAFFCLKPTCSNYKFKEDAKVNKPKPLTRAGWSSTLKEVLDSDGFFYLAVEMMECPTCKTTKQTNTLEMLGELPVTYRRQYRIVGTTQ